MKKRLVDLGTVLAVIEQGYNDAEEKTAPVITLYKDEGDGTAKVMYIDAGMEALEALQWAIEAALVERREEMEKIVDIRPPIV